MRVAACTTFWTLGLCTGGHGVQATLAVAMQLSYKSHSKGPQYDTILSKCCIKSAMFGASRPASIGESISTSTRIVDGKREDVYKKVDARGNSTIHIKDADGKQRVFVNGVQQAKHPLLGDKETEEKPRPLPAAGDGSRGRPYEIF